MTIGRVWSSSTVLIVFWVHVPAASRLSSMSSGAFWLAVFPSPSEVLTVAKIRPSTSCTDLRLMWSSATLGPSATLIGADHVAAGSPLTCSAKYIAPSTWLLHITPMLSLSEITDEMSSGATGVEAGSTNGVPHAASPVVVVLT